MSIAMYGRWKIIMDPLQLPRTALVDKIRVSRQLLTNIEDGFILKLTIDEDYDEKIAKIKQYVEGEDGQLLKWPCQECKVDECYRWSDGDQLYLALAVLGFIFVRIVEFALDKVLETIWACIRP